jgi:hypothetical protein
MNISKDDYKTSFLQEVFGAHSITKTVVGFYGLLETDEDSKLRRK